MLDSYQSIGLDKSSSDVAAEGAILNEMLDIVAKRAALRANDAQQQHGPNSFDSDVSPVNTITACMPHYYTLLNLNWLMPIFLAILCMFYFLHFAHF